jgi:hypothetical protein
MKNIFHHERYGVKYFPLKYIFAIKTLLTNSYTLISTWDKFLAYQFSQSMNFRIKINKSCQIVNYCYLYIINF